MASKVEEAAKTKTKVARAQSGDTLPDAEPEKRDRALPNLRRPHWSLLV